MMGSVCLPAGMPNHEVEQLDELVKERIKLKKGDTLYRHGDRLDALFGLRLGSVKTQLEEASGQVQITGFFLPGEIIGLDGMLDGEHGTNAVAMEDSEVCVVRLKDIDDISRYVPSLQQQVRRVMSKEIARTYQVMLATKSGGVPTCPASSPSRKLPCGIATSRTTGRDPLAMMTSSPASAASISLDNWVLAVWTLICMGRLLRLG